VSRSARQFAIRATGTSLIALVWVLSAYLLVHALLLATLGPRALYDALGEPLYNRVIAGGGLGGVLGLVLWAGAFALPFAFAYRVSLPILDRVRRVPGHPTDSAAIAGLLFVGTLHFLSIDGWPTWALVATFGDDTEFAPDYSSLGFWSVEAGDDRLHVLQVIGEPLERAPGLADPATEWWYWTRSPHDASYRIRAIKFEGDTVAEKVGRFYLD
jgi:hypothetical protein